MTSATFETAKQLQEEIATLKRRIYNLNKSLDGCSLDIKVTYTPSAARGKEELYLTNITKEEIKKLIIKEVDATLEAILLLEKEFKKI